MKKLQLYWKSHTSKMEEMLVDIFIDPPPCNVDSDEDSADEDSGEKACQECDLLVVASGSRTPERVVRQTVLGEKREGPWIDREEHARVPPFFYRSGETLAASSTSLNKIKARAHQGSSNAK